METQVSENEACSICGDCFNLEEEGGIDGFIGLIPFILCPTCKSGVIDMSCQLCTDERCPYQYDT